MNKIIYVGKHALTWSVSRHLHKGWELIYCTSGSGLLTFEDKFGTLTYTAGDVAVIPPMFPHINNSKEGFTNIHMNISDAALANTKPALIRADTSGFLLDAFQAAFHYYSAGGAEQPLLPFYGNLIVASLTEYQPVRHSKPVRQIEDDILRHYPDCTYDLNAYLGSLPFNGEYLKKMFKKETGLTPLQYLTDRRLENAAAILRTYVGAGNVSETAHMCGFSDPLYFSRLFKKKYGVSPRDYTKQKAVPSAGEDMGDGKIMLPDA